MSAQQMPARIWADGPFSKVASIRTKDDIPYYRSDITERMAEVAQLLLDYATDLQVNIECNGGSVDDEGNVMEQARSALSAFSSSTQDTEASR